MLCMEKLRTGISSPSCTIDEAIYLLKPPGHAQLVRHIKAVL